MCVLQALMLFELDIMCYSLRLVLIWVRYAWKWLAKLHFVLFFFPPPLVVPHKVSSLACGTALSSRLIVRFFDPSCVRISPLTLSFVRREKQWTYTNTGDIKETHKEL